MPWLALFSCSTAGCRNVRMRGREPGHRPVLACLRVPGPAHGSQSTRKLSSLLSSVAASPGSSTLCQVIGRSTCPCACAPSHVVGIGACARA